MSTNDGKIIRPRLKFESDFTQMPNAWHRDPSLSLKARGLLGLLMSHDAGFTITVKSLVATNPEGREAIDSAIRELRAKHYLEVTRLRGLNGRIEGSVWEITDPEEVKKRRPTPLTGFPDAGSSTTRENRHTDNPHLKEEQPKEHLTQVNRADHSTRAGENEERSAPSSSTRFAAQDVLACGHPLLDHSASGVPFCALGCPPPIETEEAS